MRHASYLHTEKWEQRVRVRSIAVYAFLGRVIGGLGWAEVVHALPKVGSSMFECTTLLITRARQGRAAAGTSACKNKSCAMHPAMPPRGGVNGAAELIGGLGSGVKWVGQWCEVGQAVV